MVDGSQLCRWHAGSLLLRWGMMGLNNIANQKTCYGNTDIARRDLPRFGCGKSIAKIDFLVIPVVFETSSLPTNSLTPRFPQYSIV